MLQWHEIKVTMKKSRRLIIDRLKNDDQKGNDMVTLYSYRAIRNGNGSVESMLQKISNGYPISTLWKIGRWWLQLLIRFRTVQD